MIKQLKMHSMVALHFGLIVSAMFCAWYWFYELQVSEMETRVLRISEGIIYLTVVTFLYRVYNAYKVGKYRVSEIFYVQTLANFLSACIIYVVACILQNNLLNLGPVLLVLVVQTAISAVWCLAANRLYFHLHNPRRTLLVYGADEDLDKLSEIDRHGRRFDIQGWLKNPSNINEILTRIEGFQTVFVSGIPATMRNGIVKECIEKNIDCYFIPHTGDVIIAGAEHAQCFSVPIMRTRRVRISPEFAVVKRAADIIFSLVGLIVASPIMLVIALCIKFYDKGPVLYKQIRLTKNRREFNILNLRWMEVVHELHKMQTRTRWIIGAKYTIFRLPNGFRHSTAGFAGVSAA